MATPLKKRIKRTLIYALARCISAIVNSLSRRTSIFLGGWLGLIAWHILRKEQHKTIRHLSLVFGETHSPEQIRLTGRGFFINSGKNIADVLRIRKHLTTEILPSVECEGLEYFDTAYKAGQGVFGVTGHIGNFELLAAWIASRGYRTAVIGRELYDKRLDELLVGNREVMGITNLATTDSPKRMISWLKEGGVVGVLIDTDSYRVRGDFIPAFGRLSNTPVGQSLLAIRTGAALVPVACVRIPGNRYKVIFHPPVKVDTSLPEEDQVKQATLLCTKALEEIIRSYPDQWIWLHNRWHTRVPEATA